MGSSDSMVSVADMPSRLRKIWKLKGHVNRRQANTGNVLEARLTLVACVTTGSILTNITQVTLGFRGGSDSYPNPPAMWETWV